ncbi:MAG: mucoidy inhibitor MuiA family protein [Myxococcales bacterium]|nr:mucoidy inhibitor MuiA family protein [Myxococcales bacterium]
MSDARLVNAPVRRVTVMEDRAQVRRVGKIELEAGQHLLRVERATPLVVDRTLRAGLGPDGSGRLLDVRIRREATVRASAPQQERELSEQIEALGVEHARERDHGRAVDAEQQATRRALTDLLSVIADEAGRGNDHADSWRSGLSAIAERSRALEEEAAQILERSEQLVRRMQQLNHRRWLALQPTSVYWADLEAVVEVERAGAFEVYWEYLVPCTMWRPSHEAQLEGDGKLSWSTYGTVWQRTGEPWTAVELVLSTARPALGAELPTLAEDQLFLRPKTGAERDEVEVTLRDETIANVGPAVEARTVDTVPGVDDGGETRAFRLADAVSVPSDGSAHLVRIGQFQTRCDLSRVCFPEIEPLVSLRSEQDNAGKSPLLAGPVRLVRDGGFMGRSSIDFVGAGERFAVGWGSDDAVQVVRLTSRHSEETGFSRRMRHRFRVRVYVSNTAPEPRSFTLTERVPVSEIEAVRVEIVAAESSSGYDVDRDGHVRFGLSLGPRESRELSLVFDLEASKKVRWTP